MTMEQEDINVIDLSDFPKKSSKQKSKENYYNPVECYTLEGVYLQTYRSPADASKELSISSSQVSHCCRGRVLYIQKYGKIFIYKGDSIKKRLKKIEKEGFKRKVFQIEVYTKEGKFLSCHTGLNNTAQVYSTSPHSVKKCCSGEKLHIKDKIFLFLGDSIKRRLKKIQQKELLNSLIEKEILKRNE